MKLFAYPSVVLSLHWYEAATWNLSFGSRHEAFHHQKISWAYINLYFADPLQSHKVKFSVSEKQFENDQGRAP